MLKPHFQLLSFRRFRSWAYACVLAHGGTLLLAKSYWWRNSKPALFFFFQISWCSELTDDAWWFRRFCGVCVWRGVDLHRKAFVSTLLSKTEELAKGEKNVCCVSGSCVGDSRIRYRKLTMTFLFVKRQCKWLLTSDCPALKLLFLFAPLS